MTRRTYWKEKRAEYGRMSAALNKPIRENDKMLSKVLMQNAGCGAIPIFTWYIGLI